RAAAPVAAPLPRRLRRLWKRRGRRGKPTAASAPQTGVEMAEVVVIHGLLQIAIRGQVEIQARGDLPPYSRLNGGGSIPTRLAERELELEEAVRKHLEISDDLAAIMREGPKPPPMLVKNWVQAVKLNYWKGEPETGKSWGCAYCALEVIKADP